MSARDITFTTAIVDDPCIVNVDSIRFVQILSNILNNAVKFTPREGRIHLALELTGKAPLQDVVITIADTGVGIPKESMQHIFELFTQTPSPEPSHGGLGIGLALARRLAEMHAGQVTAHSDGRGLGSTFTITLPTCEMPHTVALAPAARPAVISSRVVVIDDNRDAATTMAILIEELGGSARTAHDAMHGLETIKEFKPDIVLLDIGMPGMDGYEACRRIRRDRSIRNVVLVAVTGWGQVQDKQRALDAGFDAHLTKPVDIEMLESLLAGRSVSSPARSARRVSRALH
jgi:CheY-like chemotaxis protein